MNKWKTCTINDLGRVIGGATPSTKKPENYENGNIAWITPKDLAGFSGRYISNGERNITEQGLKSCSAQLIPKHSILFSSRAPIGYIAIAANEVCTNQGFKSIVPNDGIDYLFLYYLLKYNKKKIESLGSGTTFKEVSGSTMKSIQVTIPETIEEQRKISTTLSLIDDKIEENEKINKNLEQQAQALFNQVFPYTLEDKLPHNWVIGTVNDVIELHDSKRIPLSGFQRSKMKKRIYPYYGAASLMDYVDEYIFDGTYLLLGEDGTVVDNQGYPILQYIWGQFWVNNHAHILTGKRGFNVESLYLLFKRTPVKSIITGAVQPKISQANLKSLKIVIPPENAISEFNFTIKPIFSLIRSNQDENKSLSELKDNLLSKLMSGEIDISNLDI